MDATLTFLRHNFLFVSSSFKSLVPSVPALRAPKSRQALTADMEKALRHKRCEDFCREGADANACKALYSNSLLDPDNALAEMKAKHPTAGQPVDLTRLGATNAGTVPDIAADEVAASLKSFSKHSGAGPSGLRPFHLKQALGPAYTDQVVDHLARMVQLLVRGQAHRDVAPWLCGALLMALPKPDGTARPIAVGEAFRRLAAKTMCSAFKDSASAYLAPWQIGVAQPLGAEIGLQVARQWCQRNSSSPGKAFLKLDFSNAFNCVDREHFLREVRSHLPGLAPWADFCYARSSKLVFGAHTLSSECGVQQGDPLGPLLFALALQPVLSELAASRAPGGLELAFAYLDDLCLAGEAPAVVTALNTLKARCASFGLRLSTGLADSRDKCELVLTGGPASSVDVSAFLADFKVVRDGNFDLLGGPIGSPEYCNSHTQSRVNKALQVLSALGEVPDPQVALKLLRQCAAFGKMVFSIRAVPASFHADAVNSFDAHVRTCFEQFSCLFPNDDQWTQASLGTEEGGLGLRSLARHSQAAFLASRTGCFDFCKSLDEAHTFESPAGAGPAPERVALDAYNGSVNDDDRLQPGDPASLSQKRLSKAIDKRTKASLEESLDQSRRAHLSLVSASGAGLYLHASPSKAAHLHNEPSLFVGMLSLRLRMAFAEQDSECPCCDGVLDRFGDHALACCGGGDRTRRHNLLRNMVFHAAEAANLHPEIEKPGLLPLRPLWGSTFDNGSPMCEHDSNRSLRRPADVYIPRWRSGPSAAWDFAVTSGLRLDALVDATTGSDAVTAKYEDFKCSHLDTKAQCQSQGITFVPMIVEAVGGGWGKSARCVWSELAKSSALATGELETESSSAVLLRQRLSMALHRESARACLKRFGG